MLQAESPLRGVHDREVANLTTRFDGVVRALSTGDSGPRLRCLFDAAAIENLRSWISRSGGCLLCARGAPADQVPAKLAEILPVRWTPAEESRVRAQVTQHAMDSAVFDPLLTAGMDPWSVCLAWRLGLNLNRVPVCLRC